MSIFSELRKLFCRHPVLTPVDPFAMPLNAPRLCLESHHGATIHIDDKIWIDCNFNACTLIYSGGRFSMDGCSFIECTWLVAEHAARTTMFMRCLCNEREMPGGTKLVAELIGREIV